MLVPSIFVQAFRYGVIGLVAAFVHYMIALILVWWLKWPIAIANLGAFCCAIWISFLGHYHFTFKEITTSSISSVPKFLIISILGFIFNEVLLLILTHLKFFPLQVNLVFAITATALLTFLLNRNFTFV